jgi:hypothetical protein
MDATDERFEGPLIPDAILAEQFFGPLVQLTGERRLLLAVLEDAVNCVLRLRTATDTKRRQLFKDAEAWIASRDRSWFYSFENVCLTLDLEPDYVRQGVLSRNERCTPAEPAGATAWEPADARAPDALSQAS